MPVTLRPCAPATLAILVLTAACPGGGDGETTTMPGTEGTSAASTTADVTPTTGASAASTSHTMPDGTSTGVAASTSGADTEVTCTGPTLVARWVVPGNDRCAGVGIDDDGAVTLVRTLTSGENFHADLVRVVDGAVEWTVKHAPKYTYVQPNGLVVRGDGVAVIVGYSDDADAEVIGDVPWTAIYDAGGALLHDHVDESVPDPNQCSGSPCVLGQNRAAVVAVGGAGEFLVGGEKWQRTGEGFGFESFGVLRRYDTAGELAVTTFAMPSPDEATDVTRALAQRGDGSLVMFGETEPVAFQLDWWFARLTADGGFQDIITLSIRDEDLAGGVVARDDGSIVFSGQSGEFSDEQQFVASLDADYASQWQTLGGEFGPLVLGDGDATFAVLERGRVVEKLGPAGDPLWADDPCLEGDRAAALALSSDRTRLVVCRAQDDQQIVEIYEAL